MRFLKWILCSALLLGFIFHWIWVANLHFWDEGHLLEAEANCSAAIAEVRIIVRNLAFLTPALVMNLTWVFYRPKPRNLSILLDKKFRRVTN